MNYSTTCLESKNYFECIEVCDKILAKKSEIDTDIMVQTMITKGKARFHSYKRKLQQHFVLNDITMSKEGRILLDECFDGMKEAITLLGKALDLNMLDMEGSKLLDWAMIDCVSLNNQLNLCKRCLLCRQKKDQKHFRKSHVWPKFILKLAKEGSPSDEKIQNRIFGLDKYQLKSVGQCTYWMLCSRCELLLSQNGENDFNTKFSTHEELECSPWLFNFCVGIIFRTLSITIQFPMHFNDDEVYKLLILCRKHLLPLPVKSKEVLTLCDNERKRLEELKGSLEFYLFISPQQFKQNYGFFELQYPEVAIALSRDKQLNRDSLNFNGSVHFFFLCCGPITLIIPFEKSVLNQGFHLTSSALELGQKYSIPSEEECVKMLPLGVWPLIEQITGGRLQDFNQLSRFISKKAKLPTVQSMQSSPSVFVPPKTMFQISHLPKGFEIIDPHLKLPRNQSVVLPKGHQVIIHGSKIISAVNVVLTFLLCINKNATSTSEMLYVIQISQDHNRRGLNIDGAFVEIVNNKLVPTQLMLQNKVIDQMMRDVCQIQRLLNIILPYKNFDNINLLKYLIDCRR